MLNRIHGGASLIAALIVCAAAPPCAAQWLEAASSHYTVFYRSGYEADLAFTRTWMDAAEQLMKTKYGVTPERYHMSVYLFPAPEGDITATQSGQNQCCAAGPAGGFVGTIRLLTRSATVWRSGDPRSSLGLPKSGDDYHAKVLMSEYIPIGHYAVQDTRPAGAWEYYSAPDWFVQGVQEYDGIAHTTESNRTTTMRRLLEWAKQNTSAFSCCSPGLEIRDAYNGGATFMAFLAEEFGEEVHAKLLRNPAPTFVAALAAETRPYSLPELFGRFQTWLSQKQP